MVLWWALDVLAATRVAFVNPPAFVPETEIVTYYVRVPRHEENRLLIVGAFDGSERVTETRREFHGVNSQAMWNIEWRLPAGELEIVAAVFSQTEQVGRDSRRVTVYSRLP